MASAALKALPSDVADLCKLPILQVSPCHPSSAAGIVPGMC